MKPVEKAQKKAQFCHFNRSRQSLKDARCILGISVGQKYHEAAELEAMIDLVNSNFYNEQVDQANSDEKCVIAVCDTLQRFSIMLKKHVDLDTAEKLGLQAGEEWIQRNREIYSKLKIPYEIRRWDDWKCQKDFDVHLKYMQEHYEQDDVFQSAVNRSVVEVSKRFVKQIQESFVKGSYATLPPILDIQAACLDYLIEECAIIMNFWAKKSGNDYNGNYLLYPGEITPALKAAHDLVVTKPQELDWVHVRFKSVKTKKSKESGTLESQTVPYSPFFQYPKKFEDPLCNRDNSQESSSFVKSQVGMLSSYIRSITSNEEISEPQKQIFVNDVLTLLKGLTLEVETCCGAKNEGNIMALTEAGSTAVTSKTLP